MIMSRKPSKRSVVLKTRYDKYRALGYDSYTSKVLSQRETDFTKLPVTVQSKQLKKMTVTKERQKETVKKRYDVYRKLGYESEVASALSKRDLDVSSLEISKRTGKIKQNTATKQFITVEMKEWKSTKAIDNYRKKVKTIVNDTTFTDHGLVTHDKRYRGETGSVVSILKHRHNLSLNQAYYMFYMMNDHRDENGKLIRGMSYKTAQAQLLSSKEFEEYDKNKRGR